MSVDPTAADTLSKLNIIKIYSVLFVPHEEGHQNAAATLTVVQPSFVLQSLALLKGNIT